MVRRKDRLLELMNGEEYDGLLVKGS